MIFLQQMLNGLVLGHAYALIAIGWTMLLGVARLVNFSHGQMYMIAAFVAWYLIARQGVSYLSAAAVAILAGIGIGLVIQRILMSLCLRQDLVSIMIATLGCGYALHGIAGLVFGSTGQILETPLSRRDIYWGDLWLTWQDIAIVIVAILFFVALKYTIEKTHIGRTIRMVAEDPPLAALSGVNVRAIYLAVFALEGAAVALAAVLVAPRAPILTSMGFEEAIATFVVVVLGGIGSVAGSYFAALALGLFTALFGAYISPAYASAAAFAALTAILAIRPGALPQRMECVDIVKTGSLATVLSLAGLLALPYALGGSQLVFSAAVLIAILAVAAYGLDLIVSDLGEVSFAQPVFLGVGAYATALLSTRAGAPAAATFVGATIAAVALAAVLGLITLQLRGFAFSLVTYAVGVVAIAIASNWDFLGGSDGIRGIPPFSLGWTGFEATSDAQLWPLAYLLLTATLAIVAAFRRSTLGMAAMMVHQNPRLAIMVGIDPQRTRLMTFLISAPITASAGWLYAYQRAFVSADILESYFLVITLTAVIFVGRRLLFAPLIGTAILLLQEKFVSFGGYVDKIFLGGVLVLVLVFCPNGLAGLWRSMRHVGRTD